MIRLRGLIEVDGKISNNVIKLKVNYCKMTFNVFSNTADSWFYNKVRT